MHLKINLTDKENLSKLLASMRDGAIEPEQFPLAIKFLEAVETLLLEVEEKSISIERLKKIAFGFRSERFTGGARLFADLVLDEATENNETGDSNKPVPPASPEPKPKPQGHGRRKIKLFAHTEEIKCSHENLHAGESCPECAKGKLSKHRPDVKTCIRYGSFIIAQEFEIENLRCSSCHHIEKALEPEVLNECVGRYHYSLIAALAVFRYHAGMPSYRMKKVTGFLGLEVSDSTQFKLFEACADLIHPLFKKMRQVAANGAVSYRDDTPNKIITLKKMLREKATGDPNARVGITTTGIVVTTKDGNKISLYKTNAQHAGEVFNDLLSHRTIEEPMFAMADALAQNRKHQGHVIELGCLVHARRKFYELKEDFPIECSEVLKLINEVYADQTAAAAPMQKIYELCQNGILKYGNNTSLYRAYRYVINHWERLTGFLKYPGAPIDNNEVERDLKRPIRHRKNSLFFRTTVGANVGDVISSVIATAIHAGVNPIDYLQALMSNHQTVQKEPERWLPWVFQQTKLKNLA